MLQIRERDEKGNLLPPRKVFDGETLEERAERLEATNAQLAYETLMKSLKIEELSSNQAELTYQLMMKGVL